jgi:malate dehydrogenase (oxaloacetate-decarboxylating)
VKERDSSAEHDDRLAKARAADKRALRMHARYRGKIQIAPKVPVGELEDFAVWYTPGVAAPCRAIVADPPAVYTHTNKANTVAIVSDGSRVLGLGNIGPEAGLPVMEGKALLFKYLGGVDAVPLCLRVSDETELIRCVEALEPSFGAINLEDIAQPKCFRVLAALRERLHIPVWHDDQQGSATALLAGLINALKLVGKKLETIRVAMIGMGAANMATYRLLRFVGVRPAHIMACDRGGLLYRGRHDIEQRQDEYAEKWQVCRDTNPDARKGGIAEALDGADVCIAFAAPGIIHPEWLKTMTSDAIVFACANPVPEIWPWEAEAAGVRIIATGRSDFPNQVNNSLVFPGIFRGALEVGARSISDLMAVAAAHALAEAAEERGLQVTRILPTMMDWLVVPAIASATAAAAQREGLARIPMRPSEVHARSLHVIEAARRTADLLMQKGLIKPRDGGSSQEAAGVPG